MSDRPFHHGNLRTVLLDRAEQTLLERGADELSLRELAREAGVSHGAPRSHFIDRKSLLDALAERGFVRLASEMRAAADEGATFADALRRSARAYVEFASMNAALLDLMFAAKMDNPPDSLVAAAEQLFATISEIMSRGVNDGTFGATDLDRLTLLISATMQGISTFVGARRVDARQGDQLIEDAIALLLSGALG